MGFLKFLKREKKEEKLDDLDLPPAPPPLEGFEEDKDFQLDFDKEPLQDDDFSKTEFGNDDTSLGLEGPEIPSDIDIEKPIEIPEIPVPEAVHEELKEDMEHYEEAQQQEMLLEQAPVIQPERHRGLFRHEKRQIPIGKSVYVEVESFKSTLSHISSVRSSLRRSEEELSKLESIKSAKDKSFDKLRYSLDDLQKKLIFVDKTLFKGE